MMDIKGLEQKFKDKKSKEESVKVKYKDKEKIKKINYRRKTCKAGRITQYHVNSVD